MLENNEGVQGTQPAKRKLGISKDVQAKAGIPIGAPVKLDKRTEQYPNSYEFPIVKLVKVYCDPAKEMKRNGETEIKPVLSFTFVTSTGKQSTHIEFPIDDDDDAFDSKLEEMQQRIKHIFDETVGHDHFVEGSMEGGDFTEFFTNVAKSFNAKTVTRGEGENAKTNPYFTTTSAYLKLTYYKERAQMPKFPNFIQRAFNGAVMIPCELVINAKYDKLEPQVQAAAPQYGGGNNTTFGGGGDSFGGLPDFPSIPSI